MKVFQNMLKNNHKCLYSNKSIKCNLKFSTMKRIIAYFIIYIASNLFTFSGSIYLNNVMCLSSFKNVKQNMEKQNFIRINSNCILKSFNLSSFLAIKEILDLSNSTSNNAMYFILE